jgi:hypothetical protein
MAQDPKALDSGVPASVSETPRWLLGMKAAAAEMRRGKARPSGKAFGRWIGDFLDQDTPSGLLPAEEALLIAAPNGNACIPRSRAARLWAAFEVWRKAIPESHAPAAHGFAEALTEFLEGAPEAVQEVIHNATLHAIAELRLPADWEPKDAEETRKLALAQQAYFARLEMEADPAKAIREARASDSFFLLAVQVVTEALTPLPGKPLQLKDKWYSQLLRGDPLNVYRETRDRIDEQPRVLRRFFGELARHVKAAPGADQTYLSKLQANPTLLRPHFEAALDSYEREAWRRVDTEDAEIRVRAGFLRFLALGGDEAAPVHETGVALNEAYIAEDFDLAGCTIPQPLSFSGCLFARSVLLQDAATKSLSFSGSRVQTFKARNATVRGGLSAGAGFRSDNSFSFVNGSIEGGLSFEGTLLLSSAGPALDFTGTKVKGGVRLGGGLLAEGAVFFNGSKIDGDFNCAGGVFRNRTEDGSGVALSCESAEISGNTNLSNAFRAEGMVSLSGAKIGGRLICAAGRFLNRTPDGSGQALSLTGAQIRNGVFLINGFVAEGRVTCHGAQINANFSCFGGRYDNATPERPDCSPTWTTRVADALSLQDAKINGTLYLGPPPQDATAGAEITGSLNLTGCHAHELVDHPGSWPPKKVNTLGGKVLPAHIYLDGFTYDRLARGSDYETATRKRWLDRQPPRHLGLEFRPQPFEQLIKVYRAMGHKRHAREIAKFKERRRYRSQFIKLWHDWRAQPQFMRRTFGRNYVTSVLDWLDWLPVIGERLIYRSLVSILYGLECFIIGAGTAYGYGYIRLLAFLLALWAAGGFFYGYAADQGGFAPSNPVIYLNKELQAKCGKSWTACKGAPAELPSFDAFTYSADIMLPLLDLGQKRDWQPINRPGNPVQIQVPVLTWLPNSDLHHSEIPKLGGKTASLGEGALDGIVRAQTLLSWGALGLLLAILSGLIKKE